MQRCKGSRDLSPGEMRQFRLVERTFRDCCLEAGYDEIRTPTVEYLHLFTATGTLTPGRLSRAYSFLDWDGWSGERVVLRPDGTIPTARYYIECLEEQLARLFYITNIFIFEETGAKTRERWQCGAELIGVGSPLADVELIMLAREVVSRLQLGDVELRLSHVGLIRALLEELGLSRAEQLQVFDRIMDGDVAALARIKPKRPKLGEALSPLLNQKGKSAGFLRNFKALFGRELPGLEPHIDNLINVTGLLDSLNCDYQIDIASGTGFEYYTGMAFQMFLGKDKIGGGGRYDALIPLMGGGSTPASGFALYLDELMSRLPPEAQAGPPTRGVLVTVNAREPEAIIQGFAAISRLRQAGYVVEINLGAPAKADWVLEYRPPLIVVTDRARRQTHELRTIDEVLALLGEES
ncbi:ATP phosphoribosyltransferase regulatory subunit [Chloroflexota bacterium]